MLATLELFGRSTNGYNGIVVIHANSLSAYAGKGTLIELLQKHFADAHPSDTSKFGFSVSHTTRRPVRREKVLNDPRSE